MSRSKVTRYWGTYTRATRDAYLGDLRLFAKWCRVEADPLTAEGLKRLTPLLEDVDRVLKWKDKLSVKYAPATVARKMASARAGLDVAVACGLARENTLTKAKRLLHVKLEGKNPDRKGPPSAAVHRMLREVARRGSERNTAALFLLVYTGMRAAEVGEMTLGDWRGGHNTAQGARVIEVKSKGKHRYVTVPPPAVKRIAAWLKKLGSKGKPDSAKVFGGLNRKHIWELVKDIGRAVGVDTHPHALRHHWATTALDAGMSLEEVATALGHVNTKTTKVYDDAVRASKWGAFVKRFEEGA